MSCAANPVTITVGQVMSIHCDMPAVAALNGAQIEVADKDAYALKILDASPQIQDGSVTFHATSYRVGTHAAIRLVLQDTSTKHSYDLGELSFEVKSVLPSAHQGQTQKPTPYPIYDPSPLAIPWWWWAIWIAVIVLVLTIVSRYIFKYLRARKKQETTASVEVPPKERYLRALRKLQSQNFHREGQYKSFALALTTIIKQGLKDIFSINAEDMTTEEVLEFCEKKQKMFYIQWGALLQASLQDLDRIKFAKIEVSPERCESLIEVALKLADGFYGGRA